MSHKRLLKRITFLVLLSVMLNVASCSSAPATKTPATDRTLTTGISIETFGEPDEEDIEEVIPEYSEYVYVPTRELSDCEFDVDSSNHRITAHYDESDLYGSSGITVDYDLIYEDYGITEVGIYRAEESQSRIRYVFDIDEDIWQEAIDSWAGVMYAYASPERMDISYNSGLTFGIDDITDDSRVFDLASQIGESFDIFPFTAHYDFPMGEINAMDLDDEQFIIQDYYSTYRIGHELNHDLREYYLRNSFEGLPVGSVSETKLHQTRILYDNYFGSLFVEDDFVQGYFAEDEGLLVNFIYYNYDNFELQGDTARVVPLEDCIQNSLYGALNKAQYSSRYTIYGAELIYAPFAENRTGLSDWDYDVIYVPVWILYAVFEDANGVASHEIYLNAMTGEFVGYGI